MTEMGRLAWSEPEKASAMTSRIPLGHFAGQIKKYIYFFFFFNTDVYVHRGGGCGQYSFIPAEWQEQDD